MFVVKSALNMAKQTIIDIDPEMKTRRDLRSLHFEGSEVSVCMFRHSPVDIAGVAKITCKKCVIRSVAITRSHKLTGNISKYAVMFNWVLSFSLSFMIPSSAPE